MKRRFFLITLVIAITLLSASCFDEPDSYDNLMADGVVYYDGEQTVTLSISSYTSQKTTFKSSITAEDVSVSGMLDGKQVASVTYVDAETVKVKLVGKVTAETAREGEFGRITVSHKAMENGADGSAYVTVNFSPKMTRTSNSRDTFSKKYVSEFSLPYGSFIAENVNTEHIEVPLDDVTVNLRVTESGALRIEIIGFEPFTYNGVTYSAPSVKIGAAVTTFNKELYVTVGDTSFFAEYALNG